MKKDTYQMAVKHRCRKYIRRFIEKHQKRLKSSRVLCFPGEECIEIYEVYDKLRIPRKNIVCLERDKAIFKTLQRKNLGCEIINQEFGEFVDSYKSKPFDIISLDFMGQLAPVEDDMYRMVKNGFMAESAIVFTNFCGARESHSTQAMFANSLMPKSTIVKQMLGPNFKGFAASEDIGKLLYEGSEKDLHKMREFMTSPSAALRDEGLWRSLFTILTGGTTGLLYSLGKKDLGETKFAEVQKEVESDYLEMCQLEAKTNPDQKLRNFFSGHAVNHRRKSDTIPAWLWGMLLRHVNDVIEETIKEYHQDIALALAFEYDPELDGEREIDEADDEDEYTLLITSNMGDSIEIMPKKAVQLFQTAITEFSSQETAHNALYCDSFRYVGSNGTPMISDIFFLRKDNIFSFMGPHLNKNAKTVEEYITGAISDPNVFFSLFPKIIQAVKFLARNTLHDPPERIFLGNEGAIHPTVMKTTSAHHTEQLIECNPNADPEKLAFLLGTDTANVMKQQEALCPPKT